MIFNGTDLSSRIIIQSIKRGMTPGLDAITLNPPQKVGSHFVRRKIGARMVEVDFTVLKTTRALLLDEMRALSAILVTDEPKVLKFADDSYQYNAILMDGVDINEIHSRGIGRLKFLCADPFKYATADTVLTAPATVTQDGQTTPCQLELTIGTASAYASVQVGTDIIQFDKTFAIGDVLTIDTGKRTALLNGSIDIRPNKTITSEWFMLSGGAVTVYPATSTLEITYRKRWL